MNLEIITILDRSGSMAGLRQDVIGGYNEFLATQKTLPGNARVTLVQFSGHVDMLYQGLNLPHVGNLTLANYVAIGTTSLYDAIGTTLNSQRLRIAEEHWADKVLVNIITDGEDNTSSKFSEAEAKALIADCEDKRGWAFLYQAANVDAFKTGAGLGLSGASTRGFAATSAGMAEAYGTMSTVATNLRTGA